ncbi:MAG: hypothetical protein CSA50_06285, partial [Gammaproteobacteria bacterium]
MLTPSLLVENGIKMRSSCSANHPQTGFFDITDQLDSRHPLMALAQVIDWTELESAFAPLYSDKGRKA